MFISLLNISLLNYLHNMTIKTVTLPSKNMENKSPV